MEASCRGRTVSFALADPVAWEPRVVPVRRRVVDRSGPAAAHRGAVALLVMAAAIGFAGCSPEASDPESRQPGSAVSEGTATDEEQSGGMGVPQLDAGDAPSGTRPLTVRVSVSSRGCFLAGPADGDGERLLVVWPEGTVIGPSGDRYVLPSGVTVTDRMLLPARGVVVPVRSLPSYAEDGYWAYAVDYCTPGARRVLMLTEVAAR